MRKTKLEDKTVGILARIAKFAISSQTVRKVANFAMQLRNWQGCCEFRKPHCEFGNAKFR